MISGAMFYITKNYFRGYISTLLRMISRAMFYITKNYFRGYIDMGPFRA